MELDPQNQLAPDLSVVLVETQRPWLCAEVIDPADHRADTVEKKALYEDIRLPRLWVIDPRYDNVEVYHASAYGLVLRDIFHRRQEIKDEQLPGFTLKLEELFGSA